MDTYVQGMMRFKQTAGWDVFDKWLAGKLGSYLRAQALLQRLVPVVLDHRQQLPARGQIQHQVQTLHVLPPFAALGDGR